MTAESALAITRSSRTTPGLSICRPFARSPRPPTAAIGSPCEEPDPIEDFGMQSAHTYSLLNSRPGRTYSDGLADRRADGRRPPTAATWMSSTPRRERC